MNGTETWTLPVPATYVIDRDGTIAYDFVDLDHRARAEPSEVIAVAASLG
jgi:peroxiredoxin